jgi:hypothetical protein
MTPRTNKLLAVSAHGGGALDGSWMVVQRVGRSSGPPTASGKTGEIWTLNGGASIGENADGIHVNLSGSGGQHISTPNSTALHVTGDLDIRMKVAPNDWTPATDSILIYKFLGGSSNNSYGMYLQQTTGKIWLVWNEDGTSGTNKDSASTVGVGATDGTAKHVRATLDVDNGAGGRDIKFYTSDDGVTWAQLGATVTQAGVTSINPGTRNMTVGTQSNGTSSPLAGKIYSAEVRNGIDGPVVSSFNANTYTPSRMFLFSAESVGAAGTFEASLEGRNDANSPAITLMPAFTAYGLKAVPMMTQVRLRLASTSAGASVTFASPHSLLPIE